MFKFQKGYRGVVTLGEYPIGFKSVCTWSTQLLTQFAFIREKKKSNLPLLGNSYKNGLNDHL